MLEIQTLQMFFVNNLPFCFNNMNKLQILHIMAVVTLATEYSWIYEWKAGACEGDRGSNDDPN